MQRSYLAGLQSLAQSFSFTTTDKATVLGGGGEVGSIDLTEVPPDLGCTLSTGSGEFSFWEFPRLAGWSPTVTI